MLKLDEVCPLPPLLPTPSTGLTAELLLLNSFKCATNTFLISKLIFAKQLNFQNNFQVFKKIFKINFIYCCVHDDDENFISIYNEVCPLPPLPHNPAEPETIIYIYKNNFRRRRRRVTNNGLNQFLKIFLKI